MSSRVHPESDRKRGRRTVNRPIRRIPVKCCIQCGALPADGQLKGKGYCRTCHRVKMAQKRTRGAQSGYRDPRTHQQLVAEVDAIVGEAVWQWLQAAAAEQRAQHQAGKFWLSQQMGMVGRWPALGTGDLLVKEPPVEAEDNVIYAGARFIVRMGEPSAAMAERFRKAASNPAHFDAMLAQQREYRRQMAAHTPPPFKIGSSKQRKELSIAA